MRISWQPWLNPIRPYRVHAPWIYEMVESPRYPWEGVGDFLHWVMDPQIYQWLRDRPPTRLGIAAVSARRRHGPLPFRMVARGGRLEVVPPPPSLWMARESDALLLKLMWFTRG